MTLMLENVHLYLHLIFTVFTGMYVLVTMINRQHFSLCVPRTLAGDQRWGDNYVPMGSERTQGLKINSHTGES